MVSDKTDRGIRRTAEATIVHVRDWMEISGVELAVEKAEPVVLVGTQRLTELTLTEAKQQVTTRDSNKYLGVMMDRNMLITAHVKYLNGKATKIKLWRRW